MALGVRAFDIVRDFLDLGHCRVQGVCMRLYARFWVRWVRWFFGGSLDLAAHLTLLN